MSLASPTFVPAAPLPLVGDGPVAAPPPTPAGAEGYAFDQLQPLPAALAASGAPADIMAAVRIQAQRLRAQAREEGQAEGREEGMRLVREDARPAVAALAQTIAGIDELRNELSERLERDAIELALRLAEQIVAGALQVQPERVLDVTRGALRRLTSRRSITVLVNPDDFELVSQSLDDVCGELGGIEHAEAQADRRIARGGAVVRTSEGSIDAQIDGQLARARQIVSQELER
jgi:flagellar assembly protein FliH